MSAQSQQNGPVLQVSNLRKLFPISRGIVGTLLARPQRHVHAVDGVSFSVARGEILALVGESGSGKTTTALNVLGLVEPTEGEILFKGESVPALAHGRRRMELRQRMQIVFQDPYEALNPRQKVFATVAEPLEIHRLTQSEEEKAARVTSALDDAGLKPPENFFDRFPQELSGGQRQRVVIAGALVLGPELLVADEPVSMLDVSIRIEIMRLMLEIGQRLSVSYLYVTHDLAVARYMCDRIAVMYLGKIVEMGDTEDILHNPQHPYARALLSAVPNPDPRMDRQTLEIKGGIPKPIDPAPRCRFFDRCTYAQKICEDSDHPPIEEKGPGHQVACYVV